MLRLVSFCLGKNMVGVLVDKPTDPFMMLVASVDHFENKSAFATANFFHTFNGGGVRLVNGTVG